MEINKRVQSNATRGNAQRAKAQRRRVEKPVESGPVRPRRSHRRIDELAESLRKTSANEGPWETIKTFWSWTRDNVKFENGDFRGALYSIENRRGDCEEMSALFVGLCRLSGIPARSVWVGFSR